MACTCALNAKTIISIPMVHNICKFNQKTYCRVRLFNLATSAYRTLNADQFFAGAEGRKTTLDPAEIITTLLVPSAPVGERYCTGWF